MKKLALLACLAFVVVASGCASWSSNRDGYQTDTRYDHHRYSVKGEG